MSAINAINLSRFFLKFILQDPDPDPGSAFFADPDPWTQKNADPADPGSGSASLLPGRTTQLICVYVTF